jgi:hypothetical protein
MIFIIQYASTPKSARLTTAVPASATLVHVYRRKVYKLAKFFAIVLALCGALALLIPGAAKFAVLRGAEYALPCAGHRARLSELSPGARVTSGPARSSSGSRDIPARWDRSYGPGSG